ncbi:carboxylesterase/lipase family protein [Subtercola lobariae]|uniref:Carboxylic ester hydrolase n=1 Tax=Subtercola lobariae TaxID=1588641 RepID=A0A917BAW2_9MICO|nr:carboxylesterase family protein [Subtercola lobariae]GGF34017.1 carboxylic ester hydrolase [Subtercola lobariae]
MTPIVQISSGLITGRSEDGITSYLGIPYAAAPVGPLHFAAPQPHAGWEGERDGTAFGPTAPQSGWTPDLVDIIPNRIIAGDEFLNLNVWVPDGARDLPVMVWIHGGALLRGANSLEGYSGVPFARDGVVYVAINYRVGAEGAAVLEGAPLNLAVADVVAALRWVQAEISAFGGDPGRVTIFGESAGSTMAGCVLARDDAAELCAQAIMESAVPTAGTKERGVEITQLIADRLGVSATREAFAAVEPHKIIEAQDAVLEETSILGGGPMFVLVPGGDSVPRDPMAALLSGAGSTVPIMLGWTRDEARLWVQTTPLQHITDEMFAGLAPKLGATAEVIEVYRGNRPDASPADILAAMASDRMMRNPMNVLADARAAHGATTFVYEFAWESPVQGLGAAHAMELGFVFDRLDSDDFTSMTGPGAPQQVADDMHRAWVAFAITGNPGWEPWDSERPVQVFDTPASVLVRAPREDERVAWAS